MEWFTKDMEWSMISEILITAVPAMLSNLSWIMIEVINLMFMGHLGSPAIVAGVGVGTIFINVFGWIILQGINNTIATLVSRNLR